MKRYRNLKILPGCPSGIVGIPGKLGDYSGYWFSGNFILANVVEGYPDWFEEVKEQSLEEAVDQYIIAHNGNSKCSFESCHFYDKLKIAYETHMEAKKCSE